MTDIKGSYSLTDMCAELAISPSWVKKIENYLGLANWGSGQRGKKSFYNAHQFSFFRKIAILRFLGYGLEDIKAFFDMELEMLNLVMESFTLEDEKGKEVFKLVLLTNIYTGPEGLEYDSGKLKDLVKKNDENAKKFNELTASYKEQIGNILKSFKRMQGHMSDELADINACL